MAPLTQPTHMELLDRARALTPRVAAAAEQIDAERRLPPDLVADLKQAGLFRMLAPRSLGGAEVSLPVYIEVVEQLATADASTAWCLGQNAGIASVAAFLDHDTAEEIFGQPDFAAAWGQGKGQAVLVEGGYRVSGEWAFVSGIHHATWLGIHYCPVTDAAGEPLLGATGAPRIETMLFPAELGEIIDVWQASGMRGTDSNSFRLHDAFVPRRYVVTPERRESGAIYLCSPMKLFASAFAATALGLARATLDAFIDLAVSKSPRSAAQPLRRQQTVQVSVAQAEATIGAARAYLREAVDRVWQEACERGESSLDASVRLRLACTFAFRQAAQVVDRLYYLSGTTVMQHNHPIERRFRDMHAISQHIQGREDHFEPVGQHLLGLEPSREWL